MASKGFTVLGVSSKGQELEDVQNEEEVFVISKKIN